MIRVVKNCAQDNRWPLYLWGPTGRGKTCAAALTYASWTRPAMFGTLQELCDSVRQFNTSPFQVFRTSDGHPIELSLSGFWRRVETIGLVVVDEIGTREASPQRFDTLLRILGARKGKPLILTGNVNPITELAVIYDERIQSRIGSGVMLEVKGEDNRLTGFRNRFLKAE